MMSQVGTVEILVTRNYPLDPEAGCSGTEVLVEPGTFPLYSDGYTFLWMMSGKVNEGGVNRRGDGLITAGEFDSPGALAVTFPSRRLGPDEWAALLRETVCQEGHRDQRLRVRRDGWDAG